jgi:signal transduction histidine kinase
MIARGIRFDVLPSKIETFYADDHLISQVIVNLLRNAQQALSEYGDGIIRLSVGKANEHIHINVEDNGPGIPEE